MSKHSIRAVSARVIAAAIALGAAGAAVAEPTVSCATPDQWTGAARLSTVVGTGGGDDGSYAPPATATATSSSRHWDATYRGQGLGRTRGAVRSRLVRAGGLWRVDPSEAGLTSSEALSAFRRIGVRARVERGMISFRSRNGDRTASRALAALHGATPAHASPTTVPTVVVDAALMRLEGRYSKDAPGFVDALPGGMEVYPFGTGYAIRVPASLVPYMWDAIDNEGGRTFLVGASSQARQGEQIASAIQFCGATALMRRFPTPTVRATMAGGAIVEIEAQRIAMSAGEVLMTVQSPVQGRGIEVAVSRLNRR